MTMYNVSGEVAHGAGVLHGLDGFVTWLLACRGGVSGGPQEEADELRLSLNAVCENLDALKEGGVGWEEVSPISCAARHHPASPILSVTRPCPQFCVFIVVDGREKMSKSVEEYSKDTLKLWDPDELLFSYQSNDVTCHIFQRTIVFPVPGMEDCFYDPLQVVLVVKEKNGGKLNSHLWFFSGFATQLDPGATVVRVDCRIRLLRVLSMS